MRHRGCFAGSFRESRRPVDVYGAVCDTYRAEALGLLIRGAARPIATRMLVVAGTSPTDAPAVIQSTVTGRCPEYTNLL